MMILRSADPSPFGRKVKIVAHIAGLFDRIKVETADTRDPADSIRKQNPLGKIPTLLLEDGSVLYDSRVICEYLDSLHSGPKLHPSGAGRFDALRLQALADGIMDAGVAVMYERRFRTEQQQSQAFIDHQLGKVERALDQLNASPPALPKNPDIGHVALAAALGYQDIRFEGQWRQRYQQLVGWLDAFMAVVPAYELTRPKI
ncbi:MAG: glutathione S-transferase [Rhizobiales bacterium]|nr:glutathione S-transferase [Hyphomicrobiales bacterium]